MSFLKLILCNHCHAKVDINNSNSETCPNCGASRSVFSENTIAPNQTSSISGTDDLSQLVFPGYTIKRQIGRGGMGYVFEARQDSLDRSVAIKVLAPHLGNDPQFAGRFEAEAAALARLAHPNIVSIYERGRCDGRLYFVMEFVSGDSHGRPVDLKSVISRGPLENEEARRIIIQVIRALTVAHAEGIVHRDIKPGNILVDRHGNAKVADFGIASFGSDSERERFTQPSAAMGTFDYMAPEQRVDAATIDERADIYSTATMLYEMLTGRVPVGAFQAPSKARTGVHPSWDAIIARGMHPIREDRFPTMTEFLKPVEKLTFGSSEAVLNEQIPFTATVFIKCHECEKPIRYDAEFCPSCRSPQYLNCGKCGTRMRVAFNGCEKCGADLRNQRNFERFLEIGKSALARSYASTLIPERIGAAQEAGVALARAKKIAGENTLIEPLLNEANKLVETLASQSAALAIREKRFYDALAMLEMALEVAPNRTDLERARTKLQTDRSQAMLEAKRLRDEGRPTEAVRILGALAKRFSGDPSISEMLSDCEKWVIELKSVVHNTIPALIAQRKWYAIQVQIRQLKAENAQISGLDSLKARMESILNIAESHAAQAEAAVCAGNYSLAVLWAETVLEKVADHPRAIEIRNSASAALDDLQDTTGRLSKNLEDGRWFAAQHTAKAIPPMAKSFSYLVEMLNKIEVGIGKSNCYLKFIITTMVGLTGTITAVFVLGGMREGLLITLRSFDWGSDFFGNRWPASLAMMSIPLLVGIMTVAFVSLVLGRPITQNKVGKACILIPIVTISSLFFANSIHFEKCLVNPFYLPALFFPNFQQLANDLAQIFGKIVSISPVELPSIISIRPVISAVIFWIGFAIAIGICLSGFGGMPTVSILKPVVIAGIGSALASICGQSEASNLASGINSAILVASVTFFSGRTVGKTYLASIICAGLIAGGAGNLLEKQMQWLAPFLAVFLVFISQVFIAKPASSHALVMDFIVVVISVFGFAIIQAPLIVVGNTVTISMDSILILWFVVAGHLTNQWEGLELIDRRFHFVDRLSTRLREFWAKSNSNPILPERTL